MSYAMCHVGPLHFAREGSRCQLPAADTRLDASRDRATFLGRVMGLKANRATLVSARSAIVPIRRRSVGRRPDRKGQAAEDEQDRHPAIQRHFTAVLAALGQLDGSSRHPRVLWSFPLCNQPGDAPPLAVGQRSERRLVGIGSHLARCRREARVSHKFRLRKRLPPCAKSDTERQGLGSRRKPSIEPNLA